MNDARSAYENFEQLSLREAREALTTGSLDFHVASAIKEIMSSTLPGNPLHELQGVLEGIRNMPPSIDRIFCMNTFVRTLGSPDVLSKYLDVLRASLSADSPDTELAHRSRRGRMHCVYGWAGQTLMLASHPEPTPGTLSPTDDMDEFLGYPPAEWDMSIHIWQPNPGAEGFTSTKRVELNVIVEPPHSHPFAFVSYVAIGQMRQSIYREDESTAVLQSTTEPSHSPSRYEETHLERVDGVWPPHEEYRPTRLRTVEDRLKLQAGDSYFLPPRAIHDVEVDRALAASQPTITLFLCAEATVKPKSYIAPAMADYHRAHPDLKDVARALDIPQWEKKLDATARYLRGDSTELRLDEIVDCTTTYGFMHI
ncbi:hypothetical protein ACWFPY_25255 [Nocardia fluminea]